LRDVIDHHRRSGRIATALAGVSHHIFSDRLLMLQNSARDQHRFSRDLTTDTMNRLPSFARSEHSHQCDPFMSSGPSWSAWCRRWAHSKSGTAWAGAWSGQEGAGWRWDAETAFGRGAVPCCVLASVRGGVRAAERSRARDGGRVFESSAAPSRRSGPYWCFAPDPTHTVLVDGCGVLVDGCRSALGRTTWSSFAQQS
jgi:hypothetical protein